MDIYVCEFFIGFHTDAFGSGGFEAVANSAARVGFSLSEFFTELVDGIAVPDVFEGLVVDISKRDIGDAAGFGGAVVGDVKVEEGVEAGGVFQ